MQAQAGRSHPEPHVLPSGPDRACNQPEEECLHREALWEVRGCSLIRGFSLRPSHVEVTDNLQGVLPGKGNKSDRETEGAADEARGEDLASGLAWRSWGPELAGVKGPRWKEELRRDWGDHGRVTK